MSSLGWSDLSGVLFIGQKAKTTNICPDLNPHRAKAEALYDRAIRVTVAQA